MENEQNSVAGATKEGQQPADTVVVPATAIVPTPKESGKSTLIAFRYRGKWCHVSLKNGVEGIVGDSTAFTFQAMMTLKGTQTELNYERLSDKDGYKRYSLSWSLV